LLNIITFAAKVVIELSLNINFATNIIEILNLVLQILAVSARVINLGMVVESKAYKDQQIDFSMFQTQA